MTFGRHGAVVLLAGSVFAAAACGGSSPGPAVSALTPSTSVSTRSASSAVAGATTAHCPANAGFTSTVNDHGAAPIKGGQAAVQAGDFFFSPTCQTQAPASGTLTLVVHNSGQALHNVSVPDQNIDTDVQAGQTITVAVKVGSAPFTFFCKYHRTSGMVGAIIPSGP